MAAAAAAAVDASTTDATRRFPVLPEITAMSVGGWRREELLGQERRKSFTDGILTSDKPSGTDHTVAANG